MAHRLGTVKMCDKVAVIENQTIACSGTHEYVLEHSNYYRKAWDDYRKARDIAYSVKEGE